MTIDAAELLNWRFPVTEHIFTEKDAMLYALGVGLGEDPVDKTELPFVYERDLAVLPTLAAVLGHPGPWYSDPATGIDWVHVVHGEPVHQWQLVAIPYRDLRCVRNLALRVGRRCGPSRLSAARRNA